MKASTPEVQDAASLMVEFESGVLCNPDGSNVAATNLCAQWSQGDGDDRLNHFGANSAASMLRGDRLREFRHAIDAIGACSAHRHGNRMFVQFDITLTAVGSCTGAATVSLPLAPNASALDNNCAITYVANVTGLADTLGKVGV